MTLRELNNLRLGTGVEIGIRVDNGVLMTLVGDGVISNFRFTREEEFNSITNLDEVQHKIIAEYIYDYGVKDQGFIKSVRMASDEEIEYFLSNPRVLTNWRKDLAVKFRDGYICLRAQNNTGVWSKNRLTISEKSAINSFDYAKAVLLTFELRDNLEFKECEGDNNVYEIIGTKINKLSNDDISNLFGGD